MEKVIQQNKDGITMKYIVVTLFSMLTFKRLKRVEKLRKDLKEKQEQENDIYRI